jgi:hypothetical protein
MLIGSGVAPVVAQNDISTGSPVFAGRAGARLRHDCLTDHPGFVDAARYDYALRASSPCRRRGRRPGSAHGFSLIPHFQYAGVAGRTRRTDGGTIAGAFSTTAG